ncbi:MAG: hypothetical protein WCI05_15110 [Myxococcales bacterium]
MARAAFPWPALRALRERASRAAIQSLASCTLLRKKQVQKLQTAREHQAALSADIAQTTAAHLVALHQGTLRVADLLNFDAWLAARHATSRDIDAIHRDLHERAEVAKQDEVDAQNTLASRLAALRVVTDHHARSSELHRRLQESREQDDALPKKR